MAEKMIMEGRNLIPMPASMRDNLVVREEASRIERENRPEPEEPKKSLEPSMDWTKREILQYCEDNDIKVNGVESKSKILTSMGFEVDEVPTA